MNSQLYPAHVVDRISYSPDKNASGQTAFLSDAPQIQTRSKLWTDRLTNVIIWFQIMKETVIWIDDNGGSSRIIIEQLWWHLYWWSYKEIPMRRLTAISLTEYDRNDDNDNDVYTIGYYIRKQWMIMTRHNLISNKYRSLTALGDKKILLITDSFVIFPELMKNLEITGLLRSRSRYLDKWRIRSWNINSLNPLGRAELSVLPFVLSWIFLNVISFTAKKITRKFLYMNIFYILYILQDHLVFRGFY